MVAAAGNLVGNLLYGDSLSLSLAFLPPNTLEVALGATLVARTQRADRFADEPGSFLRVLAAGALLPPLLGATAGAATLQMLGFASFTRVWADWYIGAALGAVAMLPLVLALRADTALATFERFSVAKKLVTMAIVAATALLSLRYLPYPFVALNVVLMVVAFTRPRLATFANAPVVVAVFAAALATGWYVPSGTGSPLGHVMLFLSALLVVVPAQISAVAVARQRSLSQMLSAVGGRVDDIIVFADMAGIYRWVNKTREQYWGVPNEQVLGRSWVDNVGPANYAKVTGPLFERARAGEVVRLQADVVFPVRGARTVDILMQPARDEESRQIGVLFCGTDVTELETSRRELQRVADQLLDANRNLEQVVRIASHDLREPLNTIVQFAELIESGQADRLDDDGRLYFAQVRGGAARMKTMLDDVLQFVRLDEAAALPAEPVDLDAMLAELRQSLGAQIEAAQAEVVVQPLGSVPGHRALLSLVLQNLVSNAIKFVPPDRRPRIAISAERGGGQARIVVADNGIGIEPARIGELGTPFRRLHARRKFGGTGLGLAIARRIAEQHGGRIEIASVPGEGSRFSLVLPEAARQPAAVVGAPQLPDKMP